MKSLDRLPARNRRLRLIPRGNIYIIAQSLMAILLIVNGLTCQARPDHKSPVHPVLLAGNSWMELLDGSRVIARRSEGPPIAINYSNEPDIWKAQTWRRLLPDAVKVERHSKEIDFVIPSFGGKTIRATLSARPNGDEIDWNISIHNKSHGTVVGVIGPALRQVATVPNGYIYFPDRPGQRLAAPWQRLHSGAASLVYPVPASMQFLIYADRTWGVSYQVWDKEMVYKKLIFGGPSRELSVEQYPFIPPRGIWRSPVICWQILNRGWRQAARRYGRWFHSWAAKPQVSPEVKSFPVMGGIVVLARPVSDPTLHDVTKKMQVGTYDAALKKAAELRKAGFQGAHLIGWFGQGHDSTYPDYYPTARMGGEKGLLHLVNGMHRLGMLVTLYLNARLANVTSPTYLAHPGWAVELPGGGVVHENYGENFVVLCPASKGFQDDLISTVDRIAKVYHGDGVQLDQIGAASSFLCFNPKHGHSTPATAWAQGYTEMLKRIRSAAREINPDFWDWIEGAWEGAGQYVDLSQGGYWPDVPGATYFPRLFHYTIPEQPLFGDPGMGGIPYWCPTDIHRAMRINRVAGHLFLSGSYMDSAGLTSNPKTEALWFRGRREAVVTVRNTGGQDQSFTVDLELDRCPRHRLPISTRELAAGVNVPVYQKAGHLTIPVSVPAGQVEAVLLKWR